MNNRKFNLENSSEKMRPEHPKYTIEYVNNVSTFSEFPFVIKEHSYVDHKVASRVYNSFTHFEGALLAMSMLTQKSIFLAMSVEPIDNTFRV